VSQFFHMLFGTGSQFRPVPGSPKAQVAIRAYRSSDENVCRDLYRLNEQGRFPPDYEPDFVRTLRRNDYLKVIAEENMTIVGVGAVCLVKFLRRALLAFGMVHPQWHRRGVGTALLLARAAALPEPSPRWTLVLSTLSGSRSFYERFGFTKYGQHRDKIRGSRFDDHYAHLNRDAWTECHRAAAHLGIAATSLPDVPQMNIKNNGP